MAANKNTGRLAFLNKFLQTPMDQQIVKEMIQDGLTDSQILQALGQTEEASQIQPDEHGYSNKLPTDEEQAIQQQQMQQNAGSQPVQPANVPTDVGSDGEDEHEEGDDPMSHAVALINHLSSKGKKATPPQGSSSK